MQWKIILGYFILTYISTNAFKWETSNANLDCTHVFRSSIREDSRIGQHDPLFIWLGRPSTALHVGGKHGPVPMPSVWTHFVNVLYVSDCVDATRGSYSATISTFLQEWMTINSKYKDRKLFLSGSMDDDFGGSNILHVAMEFLRLNFHLSGLVIGNPTFTPSMIFFRHKSFEQSNNMTFWSVDRARQPIVCNGRFSQVEFWLHDLHLIYKPAQKLKTSLTGNVEYELSAVMSYDGCYSGDSMSEFERVWGRTRPLPPHDEVYATMPQELRGNKVDPFDSTCDSEVDYPPELGALLAAGIPLVLYSQIYQNSRATCSFYIGIFEADATRLPSLSSSVTNTSLSPKTTTNRSHHAILDVSEESVSNRFFQTPLERMDTAFSYEGISADSIALIQDGTVFPTISRAGTCTRGSILAGDRSCGHQGLVWIQIDDRYGNSRKKSRGSSPLSRATAVDILAHALGKDHRNENSEILEYIDLLV